MDDDLIQRFAKEPFITPVPREKIRDYEPNSTLDSFFPAFNSPLIIDKNLPSLLKLVGQLLPTIYNLQSEKLSNPIPIDINKNSISLFLPSISDSTIHLSSLCPAPNIDQIELNRLLAHCVQFRVAADRAAWAIHFYKKKANKSEQELTEALKLQLKPDKTKAASIQEFDYSHFAKMTYALYKRNLIIHEDVLLLLMNVIPPPNMGIFAKEILPTFSILCQYLNCNKKAEYKMMFKNQLQSTRSQLVQLGFLEFVPNNDMKISEFVRDLQTEETEQRIRSLDEAVLPKLSITTHYRNLIFFYFPNLNAELINYHLSSRLLYATEDEKQELGLNMCKSILWFSMKETVVASTVAAIIKKSVPNFNSIAFFEFLFENHKNVKKFRCLFYELQYQNVFGFAHFLTFVKTRGYCIHHKEETAELISNLPSIDRSRYTMKEFIMMLDRLIPDNDFDQKMKQIGMEVNEIVEHIDILCELPYIYRFNVALHMINKNQIEFSKMCEILQKIEARCLITELFLKTRPSKFTISDVLFLLQDIPCFIAHNLLNDIAQIALSDNPNYEIAEVLNQLLKDCEDNKIILTNYKSKLAELKKLEKQEKQEKNKRVSQKNVQNLMLRYSHLCSLHIFDMFFEVKSELDFQRVLCEFLKDLLSFPRVTSEILFDFFTDFCEQSCVFRPSHMFIMCFLKTIVMNQNLIELKYSKVVIIDFLTRLFLAGLKEPYDYLHLVLSQRNRQNGTISEPLISLFFDVIEGHQELFSVNSILNEKIVKNFNDQELYVRLLNNLRQFSTPVITSSLRKSLSREVPSQLGAAYYSLLPFGLQATDFLDVFDYFVKNVDRTTTTFWTLWLRDKVHYTPGCPASPKTVDKITIKEHIEQICNSFCSLIVNCDPSNEKLPMYLNCWRLLCEDNQIQLNVIQQTANNIKNGKLSIRPFFIDYLQPVIASLNENVFSILEQICDGFCKCPINNNCDFNLFAKTAASVFAVFMFRYLNNATQSTAILMNIGDKLLEWLKRMMSDENVTMDIFILDIYNFIVTRTSYLKSELRTNFHNHIKTMIDQLPQEIRKFVLVNQVMQRFNHVPDPLYFDLVVQSMPTQLLNDNFGQSFDNQGQIEFENLEIEEDAFSWFN